MPSPSLGHNDGGEGWGIDQSQCTAALAWDYSRGKPAFPDSIHHYASPKQLQKLSPDKSLCHAVYEHCFPSILNVLHDLNSMKYWHKGNIR